MTTEHTEALEVLREVWRSTGQKAVDLDDCEKACRKMTDAGVGFDDFAAAEAGGAGGAGQASGDADLKTAWRARLEREGKLSHSGRGVRVLVMGSVPESAEPR
jgi:hypothetical protein